MCDHGRFTFEHFNAGDRIQGARLYGGSAPREVDAVDGLADAADTLAVHPRPAFVVSPWLTVEEGQAVLRLAERFGAKPVFVSPPANDLKDDLLHTGDPCPNRRGLTDLGFEAKTAEEALALVAEATSALLVGERIGELLGAEGLAAVPKATRTLLFDTHATEFPALRVAVGVPNSAERLGTWINVDGHEGRLAAARPAPPGVGPLTRTLEDLEARLVPAGVEG